MLSFAAPLFLSGLIVLAAPILIHLINRRQAQPLRFPSIRFIATSALPRQGRRSLRDLLLLLFRLLFLAAVIIALAQPRWSDPAISASSATNQDSPPPLIFLVDASASLHAGNAWEQADALIRQTLNDAPDNTPAGIVVFATNTLRSLPPTPGSRPSLDGLSPTLTSGNPAAALREALNLLPSEKPSRIVFISDFQAGEWSRLDWPPLPPDVSLTFLPVHDIPPSNAAIMDAQVFNAPGNRLRVVVRLSNNASEPFSGTLQLNGLPVEQVSLAPSESRPVVFTVPRQAPQPAVLTLLGEATKGDIYAPDNSWHLWLGAPPPLRVGFVIPVSQEPDKASEAAFVAKALQTDAQTGHREFLLVPVDENLHDAEGTTPDILYLAGAGAYLDEPQLALIRDYVSNGGILLVTPSQAASTQQHRLRDAGITQTAYLGQPGRHGGSNTAYHIGAIDSNSALGRLFDDETARDLYLASIFQYAHLQPDASATILLRTEDGHPLLIEETLGQGSVITFALGLDISWSDLPLRNAFLPLLRELLVESSSGQDPVLNLSPTDTQPPAAFLQDKRPVQINVPRTESHFTQTPLSSLRSALQNNQQPTSGTQSPKDDQDALILWPWFALASLVCFLLESILATLPFTGFRQRAANLKPAPGSNAQPAP